MPGSVFDAVVTVFRLHKPDTKPFLDSEISATATRDNKSGTWRVASSAPGERLHRHAVLSWKARGGGRRGGAGVTTPGGQLPSHGRRTAPAADQFCALPRTEQTQT